MRSSGKWIAVAVGAVVVAAGAVALATAGGDDTANVVSLEYRPVSVKGTALPAMPESGDDAAVGTKVPVVTGKSFDGGEVSLDVASDGRPTMVVFLAHWCPHCNREVPRILELDETGGIPEGLRVVGVATGSRDNLPNWPPSGWIRDIGWKWEVMADSETADAFLAYGGTGYPTLVFVAPDGTVSYRTSGEVGVDTLRELVKTFMDSTTPA